MCQQTPTSTTRIRSLALLVLFATVALLTACQQAEQPVEPTQPASVLQVVESTPTAETDPTTAPTATAAAEPTAIPTAIAEADTPAEETETESDSAESAVDYSSVEGALLSMRMDSQAGVLLDDFPAEERDRIAAELLAQPESFWLERVQNQMQLTKLRLNFRNFHVPGKGQLPLPPRELWQFELSDEGPSRQTIDGHDLVMWPYTFTSTLLTDAASPGEVEPELAEEGGTWDEPFVLPADPDMLLQRTGNACINEAGFPPNSYDSENIYHFYDYTCTPDSIGATGCHRTVRPQLTCLEALDASVGAVETAMQFEHLEWDDDLANEVRVGDVTNPVSPDMHVVEEDLAVNRIIYRYFEEDDCALDENSVGGSGWRRLLQFDATLQNVGPTALHVGPVVSEDLEHFVFVYSSCHGHFHHSNYGTFELRDRDDVTSSKQAFCVQSTSRYSNNEFSPFAHEYTCQFQGIQAGWVDEYAAGIDVQWVDITDLEFTDESETETVYLGFGSNQQQFLCEGEPVLDENGERVWEWTGQITEDGHPIERPQCEFIDDWDSNNFAERPVDVPIEGSFVTAECAGGDVGPYRNCGFSAVTADPDAFMCTAGETVTLPLDLPEDTAPQVIRVCERSSVLGTGVACVFEDATINAVVSAEDDSVSFQCPRMRDYVDEEDENAIAGGFSLYTAPVWPGDDPITMTLSVPEPTDE